MAGLPSGKWQEPQPPHAGNWQLNRSRTKSMRSSLSEKSIFGAIIFSVYPKLAIQGLVVHV